MELELFPDKPSSSSSSSNPAISSIAPMLYRENWSRILPIAAAAPAMTAVDIAVVPPPRARAGVWFFLQASQNQGKEPFLPQIPKGYLRIKDGRITVRLLIKYLVNKLGLEDESEVEITCRGRRLLPVLTLQQVRDSIWCSRVALSSIRQSLVADHLVMMLQYGRTA
ncbi:protein LAX PANICLE 2-like [Typha angustifolia]|uniref:protein LAX PANICLE 2-like n=1 Tax=Typha angustifolia TaxID=59011 RepID=UPI003C30B9E3